MLCDTTSCISRANAGPFGHRGQRRLLIALELQPLRSLGQPVELAAQGAYDDPGQQCGEDESREEDDGLDVVLPGFPTHGGHHDARFEDDDRRRDDRPFGLEGHRVERDEKGPVGEARAGDEPLDQGDGGNDEEHGHRRPAPEDQREDQRGHEPEAGAGLAPLNEPARAHEEEAGGQDEVDQGCIAAVECPQPLPDPPDAVLAVIVKLARGRAVPWAPGPEPLGGEVT